MKIYLYIFQKNENRKKGRKVLSNRIMVFGDTFEELCQDFNQLGIICCVFLGTVCLIAQDTQQIYSESNMNETLDNNLQLRRKNSMKSLKKLKGN